MEKPLQINELVIDDPEVMSMATPQHCLELFAMIGTCATVLNQDFPEQNHLVYVRIPSDGSEL